jgi:SAM-dependent methyltransferase
MMGDERSGGQESPWYRPGEVPQSQGELYERYLAAVIFAPWAADLVARAAPQADERILDVACGTGVVTRELRRVAGPAAAVTGLDLNPGMLARARARDPRHTITWVEGSAQTLSFDDAAFTLVVCQQGLQYFPDRAAALREMRRVLGPGGRALLSVWRAIHTAPGFLALGRAWARHVSPGAEVLPPYALGDGERLRDELSAAGFQNVTSETATLPLRYAALDDFPESFLRGSPFAAAWAQLSDELRAAVTADVHAALADYVTADGALVFLSATQYHSGHA